jgi:hypothetical protein
VPQAGVEVAREVLLEADLAPQERPVDSGRSTGEGRRAARLAAVVLGGGGLAALVAWGLIQLAG